MANIDPIPAGFHTVTPYLIVEDAEAAIELYKRAFGAEVRSVHKLGGKVLNAQLRIGDSIIMLNDEWPDYGALGPNKRGGSSATMHIYVEDVDSAWQRAVDAGLTVGMPLGNQPWGDRYGSLKDRFGHNWSIATHVEEITDEELERRMSTMGA